MPEPRIRFTLKRDGAVKVEPLGVAGPACLELTGDFEARRGGATRQELTAEFYQEAPEQRGARLWW
jgi:hypothetical protein